MGQFSKLAIIFLATSVGFTARAQRSSNDSTAFGAPPSHSASMMPSSRTGSKVISGALGFFGSSIGTISDGNNSGSSILSGFYGVGGDFDYFPDNDVSFGGILRYYNTTDSIGRTEYTNSLTSIGGVFRAYLNTRTWSFVGTTGVGLTDASVKSGSTSVSSGMGFGLYMGLTFLYRLNRNMQVGFENLRILGVGEKLNGWVLSDYMAKFCFTL